MKLQAETLFIVLSVVAALLAIIGGFIVIGSPGEVRMRRLDQQRTIDLVSISGAVAGYRLTHDTLPASLEDLRRASPNRTIPHKDSTGRAYEYVKRDSFSYELCVAFDTATDQRPSEAQSIFDKHASGRQCFSLEARPRAQH